mmetsp:Transcript_79429/g.184318  ORF Transcript_79429/g.184318 Transcript_79429/m.184318 type:complete len:178 (-) Transcript_79429:125-658(-)|eukprot:CAMPEP_0171074318 /NCGR_PEP_ID=MMETSP0766_2-20121228/12066_1 /TAXON_ID=439317 /ORGANISM="Gambierdiscus australes, Strain CAWD 149" /LENGTH=177 /DNA_ID=CAMNT_0011531095 /DNA_START=86 /DNA_END=619 /DNA_ORIENTATION=+
MQNITALGPKNPFTANLLSALGVMHFNNEEIRQTFDSFTRGSGVLAKNGVFDLLKAAYGFEPMPEEMTLFVDELMLDQDTEATIGWETMEAALDRIRENLMFISKNATEYTSVDDLKSDMTKHRRMMKDPMDKYKAPMTEAQSIGWHEEEVFNERFPKKSCEETRYADEMVKAGQDF